MSSPLGVLLMAYGSPATLEDVGAYYTHIRGGRAPSAENVEHLRERYRRIGGRSPLLEITRAQAAGVERALLARGVGARSYVGMKHAPPFIAEAVAAMAADGVSRAVAIALAPQYSRMSVGSYHAAATEAAAAHGITIRCVDSWHDHAGFVAALAARLDQARSRLGAATGVIFTAHSLPERIRSWNDPYADQLRDTSERVAAAAGVAPWRFAYQSASQTGEPWLGPDLLDALRDVHGAGWRDVVVCPVGFVADHLEVLYDIDVEARQLATDLGLRLERAASLNDGADFIAVLADLARRSAAP
ncbi:MAG TPA: ferrochelatase [bacterium]|jgi:ferrochelatase|nr:ferrochelatase [bacterium]